MLRVEHKLPEARPGATLDEGRARTRAAAVLKGEFGLDVASGHAREISARPAKLKARTDWTFTYADSSLPPLAQGELRIDVELAGDEVASVRRFVFVPEEWERGQRAAETRSLIVRIIIGVVFGGLLVSAAVGGVIAWSRRKYTPRLFLAAAGIMLVVTLASAINAWPATQAIMPTEIPLAIQILGAIGVGLVALVITSSLAGLALGAQPARMTGSSTLPDGDALAPRRRRRSLRRGTPRRGRRAADARVGRNRQHRRGGIVCAGAGRGARSARWLSDSRRRPPEPARQRPPCHPRVDAAPHARRRQCGARRISRRGSTRRIGARRLDRRRAAPRGGPARRVRDAGARGSDDDPDRARLDDGDRGAGARRRTRVSGSAARRTRRRRADGRPRVVVVPHAATPPSGS